MPLLRERNREVTAVALLDWQPAYLRTDEADTSLLLSLLSTGTLLEYLCGQAGVAEAGTLTVVPNFQWSAGYAEAVRANAPGAVVTAPSRFAEFLDAQEVSDWLLVVDTRHCPLTGFDLRRFVDASTNGWLARHLVHARQRGERPRERVLYDGEQRVRAVRRLYEGLTQLDGVGVACSLISIGATQAVGGLDHLRLDRMRTRLLARGVPSHDVPTTGVTLDLTHESGLLALSERFARAAEHTEPPAPFSRTAPGVWLGPGCRIHPTSRLYGPVILHADVLIGPRAVVIGPAVVGAGSQIGADAIVSHSLLEPGSRVAPASTVAQRVTVAGAHHPAARRAEPSIPGPTSAARTPAWNNGHNGHNGHNGQTDASGVLRRTTVGAAAKRALDVVVAALALVALAPLLLLLAAVVKLSSRGPALFDHEREGRNGRTFHCWKFRTMVERAHVQQRTLYSQNAVDGPQFKLPNDPRVTWLGHWLRDTNLDELPQLWNVLRGDMSLVGPRPSPFRENQICIPWRRARLSVRPGITGLWQVCRRRCAAGDFHEWIHFDALYAQHWSFGLDLRILLVTVLTMGGRWSVPVTWLIPAARLAAAATFGSVARRPRRDNGQRHNGQHGNGKSTPAATDATVPRGNGGV
jgi:lipopolysaccharide/colanic/teichoic acid biosynthesis glycosyltransferase